MIAAFLPIKGTTLSQERTFFRLTPNGESIWSMRQKVKLPLDHRRVLGLIDYCGHANVIYNLLGRFPRSQVESWIREFEQAGLITRDVCAEVAVAEIARKKPAPPLEPEDDTFYEDVSAFADTSLSGLGVYLANERMFHRPPNPEPVERTLALVVEDEADQRALAARQLTSAGYRVDVASCVAELASYLAAKRPDAIFLDINLPDGDGFDVLAGLRRHPRFTHLPVIMLTARTERADIAKGLALAADAYVTKPYGPNALEYVLRCLMKQEVQASGAGVSRQAR